jgi:phosphoglycolate phosphatase
MTTPLLVLWDIDHTLIETRGVGAQVYAEAFTKVTGRPLEKMPELAGRTEPVIFREALKVNGIAPSEGIYDQFAAEQARAYAAHLDELRTRGRALPGAAKALRTLSERTDLVQSVLTGNTRPSSEIKLRAFDLDGYLDFDIGAYGTDDDARANLVDVARRRAQRVCGFKFDDSATVLIGDTPNDVAAARASGARIIAVATGNDSDEDLSDAGADTVLADLTDTPAVMAAIYGQAG